MKWMPRIGQQQFKGGMIQTEAPAADSSAPRKNAKNSKDSIFCVVCVFSRHEFFPLESLAAGFPVALQNQQREGRRQRRASTHCRFPHGPPAGFEKTLQIFLFPIGLHIRFAAGDDPGPMLGAVRGDDDVAVMLHELTEGRKELFDLIQRTAWVPWNQPLPRAVN